MPCDGHLYTGLADIGKRGHNHIHGNSIFVCWWRLSHGAGGVGNPGTPVKLKGIRVEKRLLYPCGRPNKPTVSVSAPQCILCNSVDCLVCVFSTCPLLVAACWAVLVKIATASSVQSSSLLLSLLGKPGTHEPLSGYTGYTLTGYPAENFC